MLSYQHAFHAGNLADVHKHSLLAWILAYMTAKPKPLTYIETHAGRGLYDLTGPEAAKTGEAAKGIQSVADWFAADHPYARVRAQITEARGAAAYPGSPLIAAGLLRPSDKMVLAELHPAEHEALAATMGPLARIEKADGMALAKAITPPTPARGLCLIDPSFEVKSDYETLPPKIKRLARQWPVGVIVLWYPILVSARHETMAQALEANHPGALRHEVRFPPVREGHGMVGSGLFVINPPWGLADEAEALTRRFAALPGN